MEQRLDFLQNIIKFKDKDFIKVLSGIRRCGKSTMLLLFKEYLYSINIPKLNIIYINCESLQFGNMDYIELYNYVKSKIEPTIGKVYILLDEIQKIEKWELAVNSIRVDFDSDIYITGSNAYLLSSNLATYLSGRYVEIKIQPLSFKEFIDFYPKIKDKSLEEKFDLYLKYGGMPGLQKLDFDEQTVNQALDGILSTVIIKDVIEQAEVREPALLRKIIRFLADNIGNSTSVNKIKNFLISQSRKGERINSGTIDNYVLLLENAFIFNNVERYDIKGKEYLKTQGKYYIADIGLRNSILGYRNIDRGHIIENVVYLALLRQGYKVAIGKIGNKEIDFIAEKPNEKIYIQVSETIMDKEVFEREIAPLKSVRDNYKKIILTTDRMFSNTDQDGILIVNIIDWLLNFNKN